MTDSHYKERNFSPDSVLARLFLPRTFLLTFLKHTHTHTGKENKNVRPCASLQKVSIGASVFVLNSYVCSHGPSPCSRPCICTCMSLACCSRWRSCCSGSDLKSTHPHLKDNGSITTFSFCAQV